MIQRRQLIQAAAGGLLLPFFSSQRLRAQATGKPPLRLVTIIDSYGVEMTQRDQQWVSSTAGDYELRAEDLGAVLQPLTDYVGNMVIPSGIPVTSLGATGGAASHGGVTAQALAGSRNIGARVTPGATSTYQHETLDVHIGNYLSEDYGLAQQRVHPHVFISDYAEPDKLTFCADTEGQQIRAISGLSNVVSTLFGGVSAGGNASRVPMQARLAVLDQVRSRLQAVRPSLLNANASTVMDAYESSVSALAEELELRSSRVCETPTFGGDEGDVNPLRHHDVIYNLLACDMASSVTYAIGGEQINSIRLARLMDVNSMEGIDSEVATLLGNPYHGISHTETDAAYRTQQFVRNYYMQLLAGLLDRLRETPEVDGKGTMFDNTVVFVLSAMSHNTHATAEIPYLLIAGDNANVKTGYHYDCVGRTNNEMLTTVAQALTVPVHEWGGFREDGTRVGTLNNGPIGKMLKEVLS